MEITIWIIGIAAALLAALGLTEGLVGLLLRGQSREKGGNPKK